MSVSRPSVTLVMESEYDSTAARRKAGVDSWRWRRHTSPSDTRRPLPARLDPGGWRAGGGRGYA